MYDVKANSRWKIVVRGLAIWLVLIVAEIIHGILRAVLLVPLVGELHSNQIGVFTGSAIIILIAYFTIRWVGASQDASQHQSSDAVGDEFDASQEWVENDFIYLFPRHFAAIIGLKNNTNKPNGIKPPSGTL